MSRELAAAHDLDGDEKGSRRPNPIDVHVGSRVRFRRMLLGMSQEKLAERLGLTFQQIQKYEKGINRIGASRLFDLAQVLSVPVQFFYEDAPVNGHDNPPLIADGFAEVSVMFADIVNFTKLAEGLPPKQVFAMLNKIFSCFDELAEKYGLEKLKTIGDSFMCAGGVPEANRTHAIDACLAALEIQAFMNQMKEIKHQQGFPYWELRLGINSGPLVAGVVGHKKFAYDVWGDTVNTASRMESSGLAGEINISQSTYNLVQKWFECEHRGQVSAKNKGEIDMYLLKRIQPAYSVDADGRVPSGKMKKEYVTVRMGRI